MTMAMLGASLGGNTRNQTCSHLYHLHCKPLNRDIESFWALVSLSEKWECCHCHLFGRAALKSKGDHMGRTLSNEFLPILSLGTGVAPPMRSQLWSECQGLLFSI